MSKHKDICGTCMYHRKEDEEWICNNPDSECYGCYTEYNDACTSYEERHPYQKFSVEIKR